MSAFTSLISSTFPFHQVHQHYRDCVGIEISYRIKHHGPICSTTQKPLLRLLFRIAGLCLAN